MGELFIPVFKDITIRREGSRVMVIQNGSLLLTLPYDQAKKFAIAMKIQAAQAEAHAKVNRIIDDQALLIRKGFPVSLTRNPAVFKEAGNEAAHNRDLRRFVPGGVPSGVQFGYPALYGKPPSRRIGVAGIASSEMFGKIGGR